MLVPNSNPLSIVDDVFNAVLVDGDCTGEVMFYGKGAGKFPTASAVVSDVISCINNSKTPKKICWEDSNNSKILNNFEDFETSFYVKVQLPDGKFHMYITEKMKVKDFNEIADDFEEIGGKALSKIMVLD